MEWVEVVTPQLGEGLREVTILRLLKQEGEAVRRDEAIYELETDKVQAEVESAYEGTLHEWLVAAGDVVAVGAPVARIALSPRAAAEAAQPDATSRRTKPVGGGSSGGEAPNAAPAKAAPAGPVIPPRTRAHCRQLGIPEAEMRRIPAPSGKLMPADVDAYRAGRAEPPASGALPANAFRDRPLAPRHRVFIQRLRRSGRQAMPATITRPIAVRWLEGALAVLRREHRQLSISELELLAFCLARAAAAHPPFRSSLVDETTVREYEHLRLGVAVQRPGDELVTATLGAGGELELPAFVRALQERVAEALEGRDQAAAMPQVVLTHMGAMEIVDAVPVLVLPSVAVLFVGAPYGRREQRRVNLVLTFDHRLINGAGAASFLATLVEQVQAIAARSVDGGVTAEPAVPGSGTAFPDRLRAAAAADRRRLLESFVGGQVAELVAQAPERIDPHRPLRLQGLSSLLSVELKRRLEDRLGVALPASWVWNHPTLAALAPVLLERLGLESPEVEASRPVPSGERAADVPAVLEAALAEELDRVAARGEMATPEDTTALLRRALGELRRIGGRLAELERERSEPIAVVGAGCRFPGGVDSLETFWRLLDEGVDAMSEVPAERWDVDAFYDPEPGTPGKMSTRFGGFLTDLDRFDPGFFGVSPREAATMDPQQRLLLEVAWEALENAGLAPDRLAGSRTGIWAGFCFCDYYKLLAGPPARGGSGTLNSILANRISYFLDLRGPSVVLDTACSSSLVAIDQACRSLRDGSADLALAGGVNVILSPEMHIAFSQAGMMAPDGRCKTFSADADGYSRGEGCALVVLKRLSDARAAGDEVLAVIRGSAVNQDGATNGLSAPSGLAQQAVIRQALQEAGVEPEAISLIEAHGTGTPLGDPIEVEALTAVYGRPRPRGPRCALGSVKTNVGHLEAVAGIAGLLKVVLSLRHSRIPRHLHFERLNPDISLAETPFFIPVEPCAWPAGEGRRLAAVSSFGVGGTNAHVVLEEAPARPPAPAGPGRPVHLLALSARTAPALTELALRYARWLERAEDVELADVCFTAATGRAHFSHRLAIPIGPEVTPSVLGDRLRAFALGAGDGRTFHGVSSPGASPGVVFLFTDGTVDAAPLRQLAATQPVFREAVARCDRLLSPVLGQPLSALLGSPAEGAGEDLAGFTLGYALASMWRSWGIRPALVAGVGVGEAVAGCLAGRLELEAALGWVARRALVRLSAAGASEALADRLPSLAGHATAATASPSRLPVLSGWTGEPVPDDGAGHWQRWSEAAVPSPAPGLGPALQAGGAIVLHLGPEDARPPLGEAVSLPSLRRGADPWASLSASAAALYVQGAELDWQGFEQGEARRPVVLPTYPFQRRRCWLDEEETRPMTPVNAVLDVSA